LLQAILFATGLSVSVIAALLAKFWLKRQPGAGWVYLGAISLRIVALLSGCLILYLAVREDRAAQIGAYALGVAAGWVVHLVSALVALRK